MKKMKHMKKPVARRVAKDSKRMKRSGPGATKTYYGS